MTAHDDEIVIDGALDSPRATTADDSVETGASGLPGATAMLSAMVSYEEEGNFHRLPGARKF